MRNLRAIPIFRRLWQSSPPLLRNCVRFILFDIRLKHSNGDELTSKTRIGSTAIESKTEISIPIANGTPPYQLSSIDLHTIEAASSRLSKAKILLHISEGYESLFHLDMWYEYCLKFDPKVIIAVRSKNLYDRIINERPNILAFYVKGAHEAEWIVSQSPHLKAILYPSNNGSNVHFLRFNSLKHVFIGHGDSDKNSSCHKFFRAYDQIWTAGQAHIDRFVNSGFNYSSLEFYIIGRPQLELLTREKKEKLTNFVYLPTWEGYNSDQAYSSLSQLAENIASALTVVPHKCHLKLHPMTGKSNSLYKDTEDKIHELTHKTINEKTHNFSSFEFAGRLDVHDRTDSAINLMRKSEFMIADISSVVTDFLITKRPIFLYFPKDSNVRLSNSSINYGEYCYTFSNSNELRKLLKRVLLEKDDYLLNNRRNISDYFVSTEKTTNKEIYKALARL